MDILVCIKQVPATGEVEIDESTGVLKRDGAAAKINPYDLYALELAFSLRERHGGTVVALSMGPPQANAALLEALHMGADRGVLLTDRRFAGADVVATSRTLAAGIAKSGPFDLILCGKQTTDGDTAQVGPELAEYLGIPHASYVQEFSLVQGGAVAEVNLGDWVLVQKMALPCLITVEKGINTPRLPSYRRSLAARKEDLICLTLEDFEQRDEKLYGLSGSPTQVERIFPPEKNAGIRRYVGTADELAEAAFAVLVEGKYI